MYQVEGAEEGKRGTVLPSKADHIRVSPGDVLEWITWGGGGLGDPLTRPATKVALEVHRGLVTRECAETDYGVVLVNGNNPELGDDCFSVDIPRTEALREKMRAAPLDSSDVGGRTTDLDASPSHRGQAGYDRGGSLQTLTLNCKAETGLDPPRAVCESEVYGPHVGLKYVKRWYEDEKARMGRGW